MAVPLGYQVYQTVWDILDWVYPPKCAGCEREGYRWCPDCASSVMTLGASICPVCGEIHQDQTICERCKVSPPHYFALRSWAVFRGAIRKAVHRLKYKRDVALGGVLCRPMIQLLEVQGWKIDLVMPVPLGLARFAERGYNQAALLARPLALYFQLPYQPNILRRIRETRSQVGLSLALRKENVEGAFKAFDNSIRGKNVLVVDDVTTSGSTLNACAGALLEAGACQVYGLTLTRAVWAGSGDSDGP